MKIVFCGTPEYAVAPLKALVENGKNVVAVICGEDKKVGRKGILTAPPTKNYALSKSISVFQFAKIREHAEKIKALNADVMITCAYGQILSREILDIFPLGVWNLHASLLPKFRGASPIQSAILSDETHTGVTVMRTEEGLDCGDMLLVKRTEIGDKTYGELSNELSILSVNAVLEAVDYIEKGDVQCILQNEVLATFCKKINKIDAKIDFNKSAREICKLVNAMNPAPVAYCKKGENIINIYKTQIANCDVNGNCGQIVSVSKNGVIVQCGNGHINILQAQFSGGKILSFKDIVNGRKLNEGDQLD